MNTQPWDSVYPEIDYLNFPENNELIFTFEENDPVFKTNIHGSSEWDFTVSTGLNTTERLIFSVTSIKLMRILFELRPLKGKTVRVIRSGIKYETTYTVEVLPDVSKLQGNHDD